MTKNTIGGKGHKKSKKQVVDHKNIPLKSETENTDYGIITTVLGNGRMKVMCIGDKQERIGHIRGAIYKKTWIAKDDTVLVSIRDFQTDRCDILFKYSPDEVKILIKRGEITKTQQNNQNLDESDDELLFVEDNENENVDKIESESESEIDIDEI